VNEINVSIFSIFPPRFPDQIMTFDIFISYAHHDNATHDAWVHQFHDRLIADYRSRSGKKLNIFLDRENLNAGNVLSE